MFGVASSAFSPWRCNGLTCLGRHSGDWEIGIDEMFDMIQSLAVSLVSSFSLIGLAEIGDKSQLVCMALAHICQREPRFRPKSSAFIRGCMFMVFFSGFSVRRNGRSTYRL